MKKVKMLFQLFVLTISILFSACEQEDIDPSNNSSDCTSERVYVHQIITVSGTISGRSIKRYFDVRTQSDKLIYLMEFDANGRDIRRYDSGNSITSGLSFGFKMDYVQDQVFGPDGRYKLEQVLRPIATFKYCAPWSATIR